MSAPVILALALVALLAIGGGGYWALVGSGKKEVAETKAVVVEPKQEPVAARPSEREEIAAANAALDKRIADEEAEANEKMRQTPLASAPPTAMPAAQRSAAPRRDAPRPGGGLNLEGERLQR